MRADQRASTLAEPLHQSSQIVFRRIFLKDAPLLLLDQATSALDGPSEEAICEALALMRHRTVIAIAHRITTGHS